MIEIKKLDNRRLVEETKTLVREERRLSLNIVLYIKEILSRQIPFYLGYSDFATYCERELGLTKNQAWKRAQVARTISYYPKVWTMLKEGETTLSNVVTIAPKITQANQKILLDGIKGASRREVEFLVSRVDFRGNVVEPERESVPLSLRCSRAMMEKLDRALEVMSSRGKHPRAEEILETAIDELLERRDPVRRAQRAQKKLEKREVLEKNASRGNLSSSPGQAHEENIANSSSSGKKLTTSRSIPASIRHQVYLRDGGRCTYIGADGRRCEERAMLEIDHRKMWCRGGGHQLENLRLLCRRHNQFEAELALGTDFMREKRRGA